MKGYLKYAVRKNKRIEKIARKSERVRYLLLSFLWIILTYFQAKEITINGCYFDAVIQNTRTFVRFEQNGLIGIELYFTICTF